MKSTLILISLLVLQNLAFGGGEGGGGTGGGNGGTGGSGGSTKMMRAPASVDTDDEAFNLETIKNYGNNCLETLNSKYIATTIKDKDFITKLNSEIELALVAVQMKTSVDSIHYPECYAFALETQNAKLKLLLQKKKTAKVQSPAQIEPIDDTRTPASANSK
jgi:hypothetical protein